MNKGSRGGRLRDWFRNNFVFSKTLVFIWGLILSHALVNQAVVGVLMDYLTDTIKEEGPNLPLREAAMFVNLVDGISGVLVVAVTHVSEVYTGRFNMLILCTAAYAMGLGLLWACSWSSTGELSTFSFALVLIALGVAGKEPILRDFLEYQLDEKLKKKHAETGKETENDDGDEDKVTLDEKERNENGSRGTLWWRTASVTGTVIAIFGMGSTSWQTKFKISSLLMGAMYLFFYSGFICYYPEEERSTGTGSPFITIYRVFKAAIKKRSLRYPPSEEGYYTSHNNNQSQNDPEDRFYRIRRQDDDGDEVHLLPHVPSPLLFLDKAAIIKNHSHVDVHVDVESEERNGKLCTVEQVREVKSLYPFVLLGFTFYAYSLVSAAGNTYFVEQTSNLDSDVGNFDVPIMVFFVLKSSIRFVVRAIQSRKQVVNPSRSIGAGMLCSVVCSITAFGVERRRLSLISTEGVLESNDPEEVVIPLSIVVLTPQYFLLGLMEGFAEEGLKTLVYDKVPESRRKFVEPCIEMLLAIGKFSSILCVFIFRSWFTESINTSRLDKYFLMLAALSFVFFWIYVYYCVKLETHGGTSINIATSSES